MLSDCDPDWDDDPDPDPLPLPSLSSDEPDPDESALCATKCITVHNWQSNTRASVYAHVDENHMLSCSRTSEPDPDSLPLRLPLLPERDPDPEPDRDAEPDTVLAALEPIADDPDVVCAVVLLMAMPASGGCIQQRTEMTRDISEGLSRSDLASHVVNKAIYFVRTNAGNRQHSINEPHSRSSV